MNSYYLDSRIESFTVKPLKVNLFIPPIKWHGDPVGHIGMYDTFYWVVSGECYLTIDDRSYIVKSGQLAFLPKGKNRIYTNLSDDFVLYEMNFSAEINGKDWCEFFSSNDIEYVTDIKEAEKMSLWFENSLCHEMYKAIDYDIIWCTNLMNIISTFLIESLKYKQRENIFKNVISYMNENINLSLKVEDMATIACMSETYFIKKFKASTGLSPITYFNRLKIYKAMTLLLSTDFSLSKVAEKIGVEDEAYFSRMFKKHTGISPNEYRKLFKRKKSE